MFAFKGGSTFAKQGANTFSRAFFPASSGTSQQKGQFVWQQLPTGLNGQGSAAGAAGSDENNNSPAAAASVQHYRKYVARRQQPVPSRQGQKRQSQQQQQQQQQQGKKFESTLPTVVDVVGPQDALVLASPHGQYQPHVSSGSVMATRNQLRDDITSRLSNLMIHGSTAPSVVSSPRMITAGGEVGHARSYSTASTASMISEVTDASIFAIPTADTYFERMSALLQSGNLKEIVDQVETMKKFNVALTPEIYALLIEAHATLRKTGTPLAHLLNVYREMVAQGIRPTLAIHAQLVRALAARDREVHTFTSMMESSRGTLSSIKGSGDIESVKSKLREEQNLEKALTVFHATVTSSVYFDRRTFDELLGALGSRGRLADAEVVYAKMEKYGITPTPWTMAHMINAAGRAGDRAAADKYFAMHKSLCSLQEWGASRESTFASRFAFSHYAASIVLTATELPLAERVKQALHIIDDVCVQLTGGVDTARYQTLLQQVTNAINEQSSTESSQADLELAMSLFEQMAGAGSRMRVAILAPLIDMAIRTGNHATVCRLFDAACADGGLVGTVMFQDIALYAARNGDIDMLTMAIRCMRRRGRGGLFEHFRTRFSPGVPEQLLRTVTEALQHGTEPGVADEAVLTTFRLITDALTNGPLTKPVESMGFTGAGDARSPSEARDLAAFLLLELHRADPTMHARVYEVLVSNNIFPDQHLAPVVVSLFQESVADAARLQNIAKASWTPSMMEAFIEYQVRSAIVVNGSTHGTTGGQSVRKAALEIFDAVADIFATVPSKRIVSHVNDYLLTNHCAPLQTDASGRPFIDENAQPVVPAQQQQQKQQTQQMSQQNGSAPKFTYSDASGALSEELLSHRNNLDKMATVYQHMLESHMAPSVSAMSWYMESLSRASQYDRALQVMVDGERIAADLAKSKSASDSHSTRLLIQMYSLGIICLVKKNGAGALDEAMDYFMRVVKLNRFPTAMANAELLLRCKDDDPRVHAFIAKLGIDATRVDQTEAPGSASSAAVAQADKHANAGVATSPSAQLALAMRNGMKRHNVRLSTYFYNVALARVAKVRDWPVARSMHGDMIRFRIPLTTITYGTLMNCALRYGDIAGAEELFASYRRDPTFSAPQQAPIHAPPLAAATARLRNSHHMVDRRTGPYNVMMTHHVEAAQSQQAVVATFETMVKDGVQPDSIAYRLLMQAYALLEPINVDRAALVFAEMQSRGLPVFHNHYGVLISGYGLKLGNVNAALDWLEKMVREIGVEGTVGNAPLSSTASVDGTDSSMSSLASEQLIVLQSAMEAQDAYGNDVTGERLRCILLDAGLDALAVQRA
ncbi:hypothetical protein GQ42DRAFT_164047 [Ramicandelaber brevisporus]|nr:hypothetical protein GQ42DRAFT_164047 [Ramicandelaber brevisporus]